MMSDQWIAVLAVMTSIIIGLLILRAVRSKRQARENPVPHAVREKSHEVANKATEVRAGLRRMTRSKDPRSELFNAVTRR